MKSSHSPQAYFPLSIPRTSLPILSSHHAITRHAIYCFVGRRGYVRDFRLVIFTSGYFCLGGGGEGSEVFV